MDNADLRRGRPTVHRQFDDATAILAGDALLTLAFEVLADPATHEDPTVRCELVAALAKAAGMHGMVGGQMLDLIAEHEQFDMAIDHPAPAAENRRDDRVFVLTPGRSSARRRSRRCAGAAQLCP